MTTEPISDERLAEIRDDAQTCLECGILFDWPPSDILALLSRLDKAEAGEPDEAKIAAARERAEALGPGMPGIMRTAFADIAENAIRQYFRHLPPPPSES